VNCERYLVEMKLRMSLRKGGIIVNLYFEFDDIYGVEKNVVDKQKSVSVMFTVY